MANALNAMHLQSQVRMEASRPFRFGFPTFIAQKIKVYPLEIGSPAYHALFCAWQHRSAIKGEDLHSHFCCYVDTVSMGQ